MSNFIKNSPRKFFFIVAAVLVLVVGALIQYIFNSNIPRFLYYPVWLICVSIVTFILYGYDKRQAERSGKSAHNSNAPFVGRVPEVVLHVLSLAGGFIGGYYGMKVFRHKTQKTIFAFIVILAAILHVGILLYLWLF